MKSNTELIEEKASEFEMLRQDLEGADSQMQEINYRMREFKSALETLSSIKNAKPGQELIMPLSEGLLIKVKLSSPDKVLLGIGNQLVAEKNIKECEEYVKKRIDEADSILNQLNESADKTAIKLRKLETEIMELNKKEEEKKKEK
ncbi:MAG: prefoldin subunit alpha [Candidatus Nanoarchaeia archaeon]|nr:prefoldin subunit alpha [Candidatus Nanoarchaeia archaeon]MDD5054102.1 prefoldin subunit alpha [Candidatus Nanoarchaeia archaeon]MDD5499498.1 prefoldin subunit alpha [Candidatus Nanoarchaeia archaeon]